ncbi:hypothetical protein [Tepidanaerobacter acetatoxydans]|uniref:hypothetical protein n=1 Tax=Tepidanaerobacter acetatoxydans TaxID=499229 RepID=UPI001BD54D66|nr:hypothetical protein [Tepidanaerobacter acetatoxydans]
MSKTYGFRLGENDDDLEKILGPMTGRDRSFYIKTAIRFYAACGEKIDSMADEIKEIRALLESGDLTTAVKDEGPSRKGSEEVAKKLNAEKMLRESVFDIINMGK